MRIFKEAVSYVRVSVYVLENTLHMHVNFQQLPEISERWRERNYSANGVLSWSWCGVYVCAGAGELRREMCAMINNDMKETLYYLNVERIYRVFMKCNLLG